MAKGQKRSSRDAKMPKAAIKKTVAGAVASQHKLPVGPDASMDGAT